VVKAGAPDTGGTFTCLEFRAPPVSDWPPAHVHPAAEAWYMLEGELSFLVGEETFVAGPGTFVMAPGGLPHANANLGSTSARYLVLLAPGGLEEWLRELASAPSDAPMHEIHRRHGVSFVPQDADE
jgi:mannose-6-phosphate isomerase-like protein (cupin superfamily)